MTIRQKILKILYPLLVAAGNKLGIRSGVWKNTKLVKPTVSFYSLRSILNNGEPFDLEKLKNKKVLIVNTASDCGYTSQYEELQKLQDDHEEKLIVLGFPANDFKKQETKSDEEIEQFCKINYGVQFPLMRKSTVLKDGDQNDVFAWLSHASKNGWNNHEPKWNFYKYLVDENGVLTNVFASGVSPLSDEIRGSI